MCDGSASVWARSSRWRSSPPSGAPTTPVDPTCGQRAESCRRPNDVRARSSPSSTPAWKRGRSRRGRSPWSRPASPRCPREPRRPGTSSSPSVSSRTPTSPCGRTRPAPRSCSTETRHRQDNIYRLEDGARAVRLTGCPDRSAVFVGAVLTTGPTTVELDVRCRRPPSAGHHRRLHGVARPVGGN